MELGQKWDEPPASGHASATVLSYFRRGVSIISGVSAMCSRFIFPLFLATVMLVPGAMAQVERTEDHLFLRPRIGLSTYLGDNEKSPFNFNGDMFDVDGKFPLSLGAELGYQFNPRYSLGLAYQYGNYPIVTQFADGLNVEDHPTTRQNVQLIARYLLSQGTVAPYVQAGLGLGFGETNVFSPTCATGGACETDSGLSFGPVLGAGLDVLVARSASLFLEFNTHWLLADDKVDGRDDNGFGGLDMLGALSIGVKFNLGGGPVAPVVSGLTCPVDQVVTGEAVSFAGAINNKATRPVTYTWDFGDGGTAAGESVTHTYARGGTYTATMTAANKAGSDRQSCTVTVCQPAEVVALSGSTSAPDTRTPVTFNATVQGTAPVAYRWDFGDGTSATDATPGKTYSREGIYTVTLEVTNCGGTARRSMQVAVRPYESTVCNVTEMNSVFFGANSSVLTEEGRRALEENLQILRECPNLRARIEGYAAPGERNPDQLAQDRARAVAQFYSENGIAAARLDVQGRGRVGDVTKKEEASQYRRADTTPLR
jgi:outer membrane protein OmpA-like peptidoglycan-associated protein